VNLICEKSFMTSRRLQQSFYTDLTLPFSVNESQNNHSKWPEMTLYLTLLSSFDFTVAVFHLHYYGKRPPVKKTQK